MARLHLFELEDQSWCPVSIRETTTDFLLGLYKLLNIYEPAYEKIEETLKKANVNSIVDCCSGSGGPLKSLREYLDSKNLTSTLITLTDKYPNAKLFAELESLYPERIKGYRNSVDATKIPPDLKGMRTFFSSFHHFSPDKAKQILQDAVNNNVPIGIFESTQRSAIDFLRALISPILMLFVVPFARRLTWRKFLFTYLIPITPFTNMWDYFVSNLRTYSSTELQALVDQLHAPNYKWEIGKLWSKKGRCYVPYLIGFKTQQ